MPRANVASPQSLRSRGDLSQRERDTVMERFRGGSCYGHQDHRIVMMLAMAATCSTGEIVIDGAEHVAKSYPTFWSDYEGLGGQIRRTE